jgi:hypothetical protein
MSRRQLNIFLILLVFFITSINAQEKSQDLNGRRIIFKGTVLEIGLSPNSVSGGVEVYQLAKYRINQLILGEFDQSDVVVDHLILTGKELTKLRVGKQVCVSFLISAQIGKRYDDEALRKFSDNPKYFYIGTVLTNLRRSPCRDR